MQTTPRYGFRTPDGYEPNAVPADMLKLAQDIEADLGAVDDRVAAAPSGTLAYVEAAMTQAGVTAPVDLTGLAATVTVAAGRRLRVSATVLGTGTVTNDRILLQIMDNGVALPNGSGVQWNPLLANSSLTHSVDGTVTPAAGPHTYQIKGGRGNGSTGTVTFTSTARLLIENIGAA